jgi:hypothetical protein
MDRKYGRKYQTLPAEVDDIRDTENLPGSLYL